MSSHLETWTRLARFIAKEDSEIHFGQPVDVQLDVGLAVADGKEVEVYEIVGDNLPFDGRVNKEKKFTIKSLLSPIAEEKTGGSIRCLGVNFKNHVKEAGQKMPIEPVVFMKPSTALAGPGDIPIPAYVHADPGNEELGNQQLDYETELAFVISKEGKDIKPEDAFEYVLGYTSADDITARFHQGRQPQWNFAKSFDKFCPIGPVLVSHKGIGDPDNLEFKGCLNGEVRQQDSTSDWIFKIQETISFLSSGTTLKAGTVVLMGTPGGIGWFRKPRALLKNGDVFTVWHSGGIGTLVNKMVYA